MPPLRDVRAAAAADAEAAYREKTRARVGRYAQRAGAARVGRPRASDHRAAGLRLRHVGHVHPNRLQHHCEDAEEDRRLGGERRAEPEQRRCHLLHGASRSAARRDTEGRAADLRSRGARLRRGPRRPDRVRVLAGVRRDAWRRFDQHPISGPGTIINESPDFPATKHFAPSFPFSDEFYQPRKSRARRSTCCCGWICRTCRRTRVFA